MTTKNSNSGSKSPTHLAYQVREAKDGKGFWTKIGAAWAHGDGEGFTLRLDLIPINGAEIVIRTPRAEDGQEGGAP